MVHLPKTNSLPLKMMVSNRNILFHGAPIFRGKLLVSGRVSYFETFYLFDWSRIWVCSYLTNLKLLIVGGELVSHLFCIEVV